MIPEDIKRLAEVATVTPAKILEWRAMFSVTLPYLKSLDRPPGTLSVTDVYLKYGIAPTILTQWRKAGLPTRRGKGPLVLVVESNVKKWIAKTGWKLRPQGRPKLKK